MMEFTPAIALSLVTLLFVILNFAFGRGDKGGARIDAMQSRLHKIELDMKDLEKSMREHVGDGYATKDDIAALRDEIRAFTAMFTPIAQQLVPGAVRR
jgi:hypothetical protein